MPPSSNFYRVLRLPLGVIVAVVLPAVLCLSHLFRSWALNGKEFNG